MPVPLVGTAVLGLQIWLRLGGCAFDFVGLFPESNIVAVARQIYSGFSGTKFARKPHPGIYVWQLPPLDLNVADGRLRQATEQQSSDKNGNEFRCWCYRVRDEVNMEVGTNTAGSNIRLARRSKVMVFY